MTAPEAERYHDAQIQTFADTPVGPRLRAHRSPMWTRPMGIRARRDPHRSARRHLLHGGDRRPPALGADHPGAPIAPGRRRHRVRAGLLHDQLRPPERTSSAALEAGRRWPLRIRGIRRQRLAPQPRRARRRDHARRRRSGRARRRIPAAGHGAAPDSPSWAAAAAPIIGTSRPSPRSAPTCSSRSAPAAAPDRVLGLVSGRVAEKCSGSAGPRTPPTSL